MTLYVVVAFQFICALAVLLTLKTEAANRHKRKKLNYLIGAAGLTSLAAAFGINFCLPRGMTAILKRGLMGAEIVFFAVIAAGVCTVFSKKKIKSVKIDISQSEKRIGIFALCAGVLSLVYMAVQNPNYIVPSDRYGYIANCFFNADIDRAVTTAANFDFSVPTHALYRFALLPVNLIVLVIGWLVRKVSADGAYAAVLISGYLLCLVQICLNAVSAVLIKRLLKNFGEKISSMGAFVFIAGFSAFWMAILPETYASALFFTLLGLYLNSIGNKFWIASAVTAAGLNPLTAVAFIPAAVHGFAEKRQELKNFIAQKKKVFIIGAGCLAVVSAVAVPFLYKVVFEPYVSKWSDFEFFSLEKIARSFSTIITPWFAGPLFDVGEPYFIQLKGNGIFLLCLTAVCLILCAAGAVINRKEKIVQSAACILAAGVALHMLMGYGRYNGVIYAPLYGWAAAVLLAASAGGLMKKLKNDGFSYILPVTAAVLIACNTIWVYKMGTEIKHVEFEKGSEKMPIEVYVGDDSYLYDRNRLVRTTDCKVAAEDIDSARLYDGRISLLLNDGTTRLITPESAEKGETVFFIFGMGPRDKFIFREDENGLYDLVSYKDSAVILDNAKRIEIIPEDYRVRAEKDGQEILIFENETGIYIDDGTKKTALDESAKIIIPDFSGHKYERELRMLFNEIAVNVTKEGVSANFMAYGGSWYRDAAVMAMALDRTGNSAMMGSWINSITEIYDRQNGAEESDNLGQLLYLSSLTNGENSELITKVLDEALSLRDRDGALGGGKTTDGVPHRAYQTRWLKFGMESLGMESSAFRVPPDENDDYAEMMWFDGDGTLGCPEKSDGLWNRWPYIYYAKSHLYGKKISIAENPAYPISKEYQPSMADFEKLSAANPRLTELKLVAPHGWSAAELFLLLYEEG